jgi:hypothetical protein
MDNLIVRDEVSIKIEMCFNDKISKACKSSRLQDGIASGMVKTYD